MSAPRDPEGEPPRFHRLFVGIPIEGPMRDAAFALEQSLRERVRNWDVAWVPPENYHLTLKFLGRVPAERLEAIASALARIESRPVFTVGLGGVGGFPERGRPRVIYLGVSEGAPDLGGLAEAVETALETVGFSREARPYHPHLTLARVRKTAGRLADVVDPGPSDSLVGRLEVREVVLFESILRPSGAQYRPRVRIRLDEKDLQSRPR